MKESLSACRRMPRNSMRVTTKKISRVQRTSDHSLSTTSSTVDSNCEAVIALYRLSHRLCILKPAAKWLVNINQTTNGRRPRSFHPFHPFHPHVHVCQAPRRGHSAISRSSSCPSAAGIRRVNNWGHWERLYRCDNHLRCPPPRPTGPEDRRE